MRLAIALLVLAACSKAGKPPVVREPPADLLAELVLPRLDGGLAGARQLADSVRPGASGFLDERQLLARLGFDALGGADGSKPAVVLWTPAGQALLVGVKDGARLPGAQVRDGYALVGDEAAVEELAPWALSTLAGRPADAPTLVVHSRAVIQHHRADLLGGAFAFVDRAGAPALVFLLEQSEELVASVDANGERLQLFASARPRPASVLARAAAAQRPSEHTLVGKLPAGEYAFFLSGTLRLAEVKDVVYPLLARAVGAWPGPLLDALTGELAVGAGKAGLLALAGIADGDRVLRQLLAGGRLDVSRHDDVAVHELEGAQLASWDGLVGLAGEKKGLPVAALVDAWRGRGERVVLPVRLVEELAASKARRESLLLWMDLGGLAQVFPGLPSGPSAQVVAGLAFVDGRIELRYHMTAADLRALFGG